MIQFDPSPWILLATPFWFAIAYVTHRGLVRNEFRVRAKNGWAHYPTWSIHWVIATVTNFIFFGFGAWIFYMTLFHGSDFSREPELPMPAVTGELIETVHVARSSDSLAQCMADLIHGQLFNLGRGDWRFVVRNGRNSVMYTFEIVPERGGSRMDVRRSMASPFVGWYRCTHPAEFQ